MHAEFAANIQTVINYVKARDWRTNNYGDTAQCMAGIIGKALGIKPVLGCVWGSDTIRDAFGLEYHAGLAMFGLRDHYADGSERGHDFRSIQSLSTEEQNDVYVDMLEHLIASDGKEVKFQLPFENEV